MTAKIIMLVGAGGFIGSVARYLTTFYLMKAAPGAFPFGTFAVNIIGCLIIGLAYGFSEKFDWFHPEWRLFIATGICGGFTTFSAFAYENIKLLQQGEWTIFAWYSISSFIVSLLAVAAGLMLRKI